MDVVYTHVTVYTYNVTLVCTHIATCTHAQMHTYMHTCTYTCIHLDIGYKSNTLRHTNCCCDYGYLLLDCVVELGAYTLKCWSVIVAVELTFVVEPVLPCAGFRLGGCNSRQDI